MAIDGHIENVLQKKMVLETGVILFYLSKVSHRTHFWNHSAFDKSECQNSRWSPSAISLVFRFKSSDPLFLLNVTSETRFKQYLLILCSVFAHISTMITKKSRDKYIFQIENQSYLVRSFSIGVTKLIAMTMTDVVKLSICIFIMVLHVNFWLC